MLVSDTHEWNPTSKIREQKLFCLDFWSRISLPQTLWMHQQCAGMTILTCTYQLQEYAKNQVWIGRFWNFPHFQVMLMSWFNSFSLSSKSSLKAQVPDPLSYFPYSILSPSMIMWLSANSSSFQLLFPPLLSSNRRREVLYCIVIENIELANSHKTYWKSAASWWN